MGVADFDNSKTPWLAPTLHLSRKRLELNRPILGVSLGAQLLALAAGGDAVPLMVGEPPLPLKEVGFGAIASPARRIRSPSWRGSPPVRWCSTGTAIASCCPLRPPCWPPASIARSRCFELAPWPMACSFTVRWGQQTRRAGFVRTTLLCGLPLGQGASSGSGSRPPDGFRRWTALGGSCLATSWMSALADGPWPQPPRLSPNPGHRARQPPDQTLPVPAATGRSFSLPPSEVCDGRAPRPQAPPGG